MKGANLRAVIHITFQEAVFGCEKELEVNLKDPCKSCNGTGAKPGTSPVTCPKCQGKGQIVYTQQSMFGMMQNVTVCPDCQGTGKIIKKNVRTAGEPDIPPPERRFRYLCRPGSTTGRVSGSGRRESREPTAVPEAICWWRYRWPVILCCSVRI